MDKNDALKEILDPNQIADLNNRWELLTDDLFDDKFDYEFFKSLAVHTFAFLFPYHVAEFLPREIMSVLFKIKEFVACPIAVSRESDAAQLVAQSFCLQIEKGWLSIDDKIDENKCVVFDHSDDYYIIDAGTFDLSEML